ncbi:MAG: hypothetical protein HQM08_01265 [Candidatus Riflebacteria bacterium]|nr:hypothetical protein [Candidatus Riflebacteria bacterium]
MKSLSINQVSAILITKEKEYPKQVLKHVESFGFGEILIQKESHGIYRRYIESPKFKDVYVQDDDCIPRIDQIFSQYDGEFITCGMTNHHIEAYRNSKICLVGHGAFFPWKRIDVIEKYKNNFGMDNDYLIETDRIFTFLNFPQNRIGLPLIQLVSSFSCDRLSMRKEHYKNLWEIEKKLNKFFYFSISRRPIFFNVLRYGLFIFSRSLKNTF